MIQKCYRDILCKGTGCRYSIVYSIVISPGHKSIYCRFWTKLGIIVHLKFKITFSIGTSKKSFFEFSKTRAMCKKKKTRVRQNQLWLFSRIIPIINMVHTWNWHQVYIFFKLRFIFSTQYSVDRIFKIILMYQFYGFKPKIYQVLRHLKC